MEPRPAWAQPVRVLLLIAAVLLFLLAAFAVPIGRTGPLPWGLACFAAALLF